MKHIKLFESYDERVFKDDSFLDDLMNDINLVFADLSDLDALSYDTYYRSRGFIDVVIDYEVQGLAPCPFTNERWQGDWVELYEEGNFDTYIEWQKKIIEVIEEISIGVKRISDMYPDLNFIPQHWESSQRVKIRIFK